MKFNDEELKELAIISIENYLNPVNIKCKYTKEYIETNCNLAIKMLINNSLNLKDVTNGINGISSISQGSQSISFNSNSKNGFMVITEDVKGILPRAVNFLAW